MCIRDRTYIARALAGEVGAAFMNVRISDVLGHYIGDSENNLHDVFETARACAPVVLFLDEIDAVGMRRSPSSASYMRPVTNQLLMELDGIGADNEGVFILAATNTPWDVDPALRRPGRFDRCVAVLPPDLSLIHISAPIAAPSCAPYVAPKYAPVALAAPVTPALAIFSPSPISGWW